MLEFLVGTHRDIIKSSTCVASVFVDCIASLPACQRFWPQALAEALKVNRTVTNIDLSNNRIGREGAEAWGWARGRLWGEVEGWWLRRGSHKRWACGSFEKVSEMKRHQFEQSFNLTDLLGLIRLNFPFVCNFLLNNLHLIEFLLKFLSISLRTQHLLLRDISTCSHCKRISKDPRVSWEVGALLSTFMQLELDFLRFTFFYHHLTFLLEFLVGTHRDIIKSSTCVASVFVDCIASLPACQRFWPQALAEALKVNRTVTNIDLSNNRIGREGAEAWGWARGRLWGEVEGWWLRRGSHKRWACGSFEKVSEMKRHQFEQSFNLTDLLGLISLNFPFVCNFLLNNLRLIEFLLKFLSISLRTQHLLLRDISTCSHCKRISKDPRVSWEVGALLSTFMQLELDFLRFTFFYHHLTFLLEFLVGTHRDIIKSSTCVASVFVDCIASLPACHRFWPQALAEALKVNKTVTNIRLQLNKIGNEEAKAWCSAGGRLWGEVESYLGTFQKGIASKKGST